MVNGISAQKFDEKIWQRLYHPQFTGNAPVLHGVSNSAHSVCGIELVALPVAFSCVEYSENIALRNRAIVKVRIKNEKRPLLQVPVSLRYD
jgi:hypothetical protein